jgi:hypothetical protein
MVTSEIPSGTLTESETIRDSIGTRFTRKRKNHGRPLAQHLRLRGFLAIFEAMQSTQSGPMSGELFVRPDSTKAAACKPLQLTPLFQNEHANERV